MPDDVPQLSYIIPHDIYLDASNDLYVTTSQDGGLYSSTGGGAGQHQCRWSDGSPTDVIPCVFYDTKNPQGWTDTAIPTTTARPPDSGGLGSSPYALSFIAFTDEAKRFAVFPDRILYPSADSTDDTPYKAVGFPHNCGGLVSRCWLVRSRLGRSCRVRCW